MHNKYGFFLIGLMTAMLNLPTQGDAQGRMGCADLQSKCWSLGCEGIGDYPKGYEQCIKGNAPHTLKVKCFHACEKSRDAGECDNSNACKRIN